MNAILNDAHVMAWLAWLKRLEAQLWTLDGFDSHVTDWLAQLPKNREQKQYEDAFPLFENLGELLDERELLKSARKSQDSLGKESTDRLLSRLEDDVKILYSSLGLGPDGKTQSMPFVNDSASGGVEPAGSAKPLQRTAAQDSAILCEIEKRGYDPQALPKNPPGKPGAKAAIRASLSENSLFTGGTVFDKAWERLTARADIAIQG